MATTKAEKTARTKPPADAKAATKTATRKTEVKSAVKGAASVGTTKPAEKQARTAGRSASTAKKKAIPTLSTQQRRCYVEVAAYYIAERRGFTGGGQLEDWVQAEAEIDRLLLEGILKP